MCCSFCVFFFYSVNLTEYVAMEPRVYVCVCVCVYVPGGQKKTEPGKTALDQ